MLSPLPDPPVLDVVRFTVPGLPISQGSKKLGRNRRTGRAQILDDNDALKAWRDQIGYVCNRVWGTRAALDESVMVNATFRLPRPASWPAWRRWANTKPDLDKLYRAVLDGLHINGQMLREDSRVVTGQVDKRVVPAGGEGVDIEVVLLGAAERAGYEVRWTWTLTPPN